MAFLLSNYIRTVPSSNLGRDTDYPDRLYFSSVSTVRYWCGTLNYATTTYFHILCKL